MLTLDTLSECYARPALVRQHRYALGRYEVLVLPLPGAPHMALYRVYTRGKLIGSRITPPSLADCRTLEHPPVVPHARFIAYNGARGRPRKDAARPAWWSQD